MLDYRSLIDKPFAAHRDKLGLAVACAYAGYGARASSADVPIDEPPYEVIESIARVPVCGMLMRRSYGRSYGDVRAAVAHAMVNPRVAGLVLDVDSMGGEVSDLFSCADFIYSQRGVKPMVALCDSAYAGSYLLGSATDRVYISVCGGVGSIGVCAIHVDISEADAKAGLKISFISSGAKKLYANPHEPLADPAKEEMQIEVNRLSKMLIDAAARNRKVPARRIADMEAGCFFGERATPLLADEVSSLDDCIADVMTTCGTSPARGKYSQISRERRRIEALRLAGPVPTDLELRRRKLDRLREGR